MKFHEMTWPQLREVKRDRTVVIAPIASCEQHSRHLPTFTDSILVGAVAEGVARKLPDRVLLLPVQWFGASEHHLPFGATLTARVDTHITLLCELLAPLLADGYQRVMLLNGHGGNIDTLHVALRRLQPLYRDALLTGASYWEMAEPELDALCEGPRHKVGHACEIETSLVLALRPELVRREEIKDDYERYELPTPLRGLFVARDMAQQTHQGAVGYPSYASAEKGQKFLQAAVNRVAEVVQALLEQPLPT
ncbi:MAG: creatininase family protein [Planctomycetes bacterium]|nr:creatininase family protein [Planctomycetota bacterium]